MNKLPKELKTMKHGDIFICPTCGMIGRIDIDTPSGEKVAFDDAIWWNSYENNWECVECWLK